MSTLYAGAGGAVHAAIIKQENGKISRRYTFASLMMKSRVSMDFSSYFSLSLSLTHSLTHNIYIAVGKWSQW